MSKELKIAALLCIVVALGVVATLGLFLFRYEYDDKKLTRVDRLSGEVQIWCSGEIRRFVVLGDCLPSLGTRVQQVGDLVKLKSIEQLTCEARNDFFRDLRRKSLAKGEKYDSKAPPWEIKPWLAPDWAPEHCPK